MSLLDLSSELLLSIASFLRQVDLLNLALTCSTLRCTTEPELYREYSNPRLYSRSFLPFVKKILERPELCKYVKKLDFKNWDTLDAFNPTYYERLDGAPDEGFKEAEFDQDRHPEPTEAEYLMITEAAKMAGVITDVFPFEQESHIVNVAKPMKSRGLDSLEPWYTYVFDRDIAFSQLPYDRKFCQILRAGLEDSLVVLIVALLPNVREILLRDVPCDTTTLTWRAKHGFSQLRQLTACAFDEQITWPINFFNSVLAKSKLITFEASNASSWYQDDFQDAPLVEMVRPLSLHPGTLNLKNLRLESCYLESSDIQALLQACPSLKSFFYTSGFIPHARMRIPSPAKMVELLKPFENKLENLHLDLDINQYEDEHEVDPELIQSLAHMTALKLLCTTTDNWYIMGEEVNFQSQADDLPTEHHLCSQLPPQLEILWIFLSNEDQAIDQIRDLIRTRSEILPKLSDLVIGGINEDNLEEIEELVDDEREYLNAGPQPLSVSFAAGTFQEILHIVVQPDQIPETKWFGHKYAARHRKPIQVDRMLELVAAKYSRTRLDEDEAAAMFASDTELQVEARRLAMDPREVQYESSDQD